MISKERLAELRAIGKAATPGEWDSSYCDWDKNGDQTHLWAITGSGKDIFRLEDGYYNEKELTAKPADIDFIVTARNEWDTLLDEIERLQHENNGLQESGKLLFDAIHDAGFDVEVQVKK